MVRCRHQMLSRRDKAKGEYEREEYLHPVKVTVTREGFGVIVVRKLTLSKITTCCFVFIPLLHSPALEYSTEPGGALC